MAHLLLDQAQLGMVLAADVLDRRGRLLVPAGCDLTERHLLGLRTWGVAELDVVGDAPSCDGDGPISPEVLAQAEADTTHLFSQAAESHSFLDALRNLSRQRRARDLAQAVGA